MVRKHFNVDVGDLKKNVVLKLGDLMLRKFCSCYNNSVKNIIRSHQIPDK